MLRCVQIGLSIRDLDLLTIGMVNEMFILHFQENNILEGGEERLKIKRQMN